MTLFPLASIVINKWNFKHEMKTITLAVLTKFIDYMNPSNSKQNHWKKQIGTFTCFLHATYSTGYNCLDSLQIDLKFLSHFDFLKITNKDLI